jgi:hypothetical protein
MMKAIGFEEVDGFFVMKSCDSELLQVILNRI